ncbi:hypothetical protein CDAR_503541, partial [Caerostris darwini]
RRETSRNLVQKKNLLASEPETPGELFKPEIIRSGSTSIKPGQKSCPKTEAAGLPVLTKTCVCLQRHKRLSSRSMATHSWWANTRESESCPAISAGVLTNYPGVGHKRIPGSKSLQGIPGLICISTSVIRKSRSRNRPVVK